MHAWYATCQTLQKKYKKNHVTSSLRHFRCIVTENTAIEQLLYKHNK